jgi:hypothetical protein
MMLVNTARGEVTRKVSEQTQTADQLGYNFVSR